MLCPPPINISITGDKLARVWRIMQVGFIPTGHDLLFSSPCGSNSKKSDGNTHKK